MIRAFDWRKRKGTHLASRHAVVVLFLLMWSTCLVAQPVINTDTLSVENLVNQVLLGGNLQATNITYQGLPDQFGLLTSCSPSSSGLCARFFFFSVSLLEVASVLPPSAFLLLPCHGRCSCDLLAGHLVAEALPRRHRHVV